MTHATSLSISAFARTHEYYAVQSIIVGSAFELSISSCEFSEVKERGVVQADGTFGGPGPGTAKADLGVPPLPFPRHRANTPHHTVSNTTSVPLTEQIPSFPLQPSDP